MVIQRDGDMEKGDTEKGDTEKGDTEKGDMEKNITKVIDIVKNKNKFINSLNNIQPN